MTVLHTGWSKKFSAGWDSIFGGRKTKSRAKVRPPEGGTTSKAKKKSAKKQRTTKKVHSKR
jgi:hypothetical protein